MTDGRQQPDESAGVVSSALDAVPEEAPPPTRTAWMDSARVLTIGTVVLIHVLAPTVEGRQIEIGSAGWWVANSFNSACRWCVPVFLMIAGALALDPARVSRPRDFYRKRWQRIGVPLVFWTVFYLAFRAYVLGQDVGPGEAAEDVAAGAPFLQLYFLYILAGLALITPFLKVITRHATCRMTLGFGVVLTGLGVVDQVVSYSGGVGEPNAATRFLPFAGYYVLGWCLRDVLLPRRWVLPVWLAFVVSVVVTAVLAAVNDFGNLGRYAYDFLSPTVTVMSLTAFLLLHRLLRVRGVVLRRWAHLAFGVFLVHGALVYGFRSTVGLPTDVFTVLVWAFGLTTLYGLASAAITWVALKVPYLRMVLGEPAGITPGR
ncbi:MAG TPA: acyltransferase family protein [Actinomycetales bacterium]|nr:acyltransferase family protein [Actinomycetales bacterium]